ncbi:MAG: tetratricopeptide repeat protein [Cyanobacteriota bacterium]
MNPSVLTPFALWTLTLSLTLGLVGCSDPEPTGPKLHPDDCLKTMSLSALPTAIQACDSVIQAYPHNPLPLRDRALLWSLKGDDVRACRDLRRALALARQAGTGTNQRMLDDLRVSLRTCATH